MQRSFKTFADAFKATHRPTPVAANDNRPRKAPEPKYRGTLPALRWLLNNHPDLAKPMAEAVKSLSSTNWRADAVDNDVEIRPTVGELIAAATAEVHKGEDGSETIIWHDLVVEPKPPGATHEDPEWIQLGNLRFNRGALVEWGATKKGRKLRPSDRTVPRESDRPSERSPKRYLSTKPTTPSPLKAEPLPRNMSDAPALPPMYDPLPRVLPNANDKRGRYGVEEGRALLSSLGADGSVAFEDLPLPATKCPPAIAKSAGFLGGVSRSTGNASSGAPEIWEGPAPRPKGEAWHVVEVVGARGNLGDIGTTLGYTGANAIAMGKTALVNAARTLVAANDNQTRKIAS